MDLIGATHHAPAPAPAPPRSPIHYYGDTVRMFFMIAAAVMLVTLPFFYGRIPALFQVLPIAIILLALVAGFTNPRHRAVALANLLIATAGVLLYGAVAVRTYRESGGEDAFFWTSQVLALDFLLALYYASKTIRGMVTKLVSPFREPLA